MAVTDVLKTIYTKEKMQELIYKNHQFLAMIPKNTKFTGENKVIPVQFGTSQNRSANFTKAKATRSDNSYKKFTITRSPSYSIAYVSNENILASKSDAGAFVDLLEKAVNGAIATEKRHLNQSLFGSGTGKIGKRASISGSIVTLTDRIDAKNFEVGMVIEACDTDGGGTIRVGSATVSKVNRKLGEITADWASITSFANSDFLYQSGDYDSQLKGLEAWIPVAGPSATSFFGVDRTVDSERLGGVNKDISALPLEEGLIDLVADVHTAGGSPDVIILNPTREAELVKALGSKAQYLDHKVGEFGFQYLKLNTPAGIVKVISERDCPTDKAYVLQMDTWCLESLGEAIQILDMDGNKMLREASYDSNEIRVGGYRQMSCNAPGFNGVGKLA